LQARFVMIDHGKQIIGVLRYDPKNISGIEQA
jgi:hypothetical protein